MNTDKTYCEHWITTKIDISNSSTQIQLSKNLTIIIQSIYNTMYECHGDWEYTIAGMCNTTDKIAPLSDKGLMLKDQYLLCLR